MHGKMQRLFLNLLVRLHILHCHCHAYESSLRCSDNTDAQFNIIFFEQKGEKMPSTSEPTSPFHKEMACEAPISRTRLFHHWTVVARLKKYKSAM